MSNNIAKLETRELEGEEGIIYAIMCAINVNDEASLEKFVEELVEAINVQRTASPTTTSSLCISMIGDVGANKMSKLIIDHASKNEIFGYYLSQMKIADLVHGTKEGELIEEISLI